MSTFDRVQFGNRLKEMRIAAGFMRQIDLAEKIGTIVQTISNYEKGIRLPDAEMLSRIVEVLPCNADYLLGFEFKPTYSTAYIAEETGLSDNAISKLIACKSMESDSNPLDYISLSNFLSCFIQSDQMNAINQLIRDYAEYANISNQNDWFLKDAYKNLEYQVKLDEEHISPQDKFAEREREEYRSFKLYLHRMRSIIGRKNFEMSLLAAKYQAVNIYGEFLESYLKQLIGIIELSPKDLFKPEIERVNDDGEY